MEKYNYILYDFLFICYLLRSNCYEYYTSIEYVLTINVYSGICTLHVITNWSMKLLY